MGWLAAVRSTWDGREHVTPKGVTKSCWQHHLRLAVPTSTVIDATKRTIAVPLAGVIALVPDAWGMHWMGRHDTLTRFARHFPTVWVNPARGWREAWLPSRAAAALHSEPGPDTPNFLVYEASPWLPRIHRPSTAARFLERRRLLRARRLLRDRGCKQIVLYLWRPEFAPALDLVPHDVSCYAIEDEYTFSDVELPIDPLEAALIARVDQVFISSKAMFERKGVDPSPHAVRAKRRRLCCVYRPDGRSRPTAGAFPIRASVTSDG